MRRDKIVLYLSILLYPVTIYADGPHWDSQEQGEEPSLDFGEELAFSQTEIRSGADQGFGLNLGVAVPWQSVGFAWWKAETPVHAHDAGVGFGAFDLVGHDQGARTTVEVDAYNAHYGYRWFLRGFPIYLEPILGVVSFRGRQSRIGGAGKPEFSGTALLTAAHGGIQFLYPGGIYLDYSLVRIGRLFLTSFDLETGGSTSFVKKQLGRPLSWGIFNLTLGYWF